MRKLGKPQIRLFFTCTISWKLPAARAEVSRFTETDILSSPHPPILISGSDGSVYDPPPFSIT